ncbi:MAG TPA: LuxR C-terminal-related transcriptional regulator [Actinophytocola sp.]|jgi:LuxR family maltose regulon positive regulatory protein|nr:LuxR C-terminal-related transcriptional regulator [Actinophytocola sp.]
MLETTGGGRRRVAATKLAAPEPPARLVSRPRLLARLDQAHESLVTLLSAPAGAGKTLLLAEWVSIRGADETAWVSLDADDNDERRFWSAVLDALAGAAPVPAGSPLATLAVPPVPGADPGFLAEVGNALEDLPEPVVLVLDDLQELTSVRGLEALLQHHPAGLRLVLSARTDPQLPLARLRLADQLTEIRDADLRFSTAEARVMLATAEIELSHDQLHRLLEQTEGWAAALRLATLALAGSSDPDRFLADFATNDRAVAAYLVDEVLSGLPADMREFLRTVSVLEQVDAHLAAELSGRADAGALLDAIAERTSLIFRVDTDPPRFHVHTLLRSHLLAGLGRLDPERAAGLQGAAADWYAARGAPGRALAHATRAADPVRTAALLHRYALPLALDGRHELVRGALDALGPRPVVEDGLLALVSALLHLEQGDPAGADRDLGHADAAWPAEPDPDLEALRTLVRSRRAQFSGDIDDLARATGDLAGTVGTVGMPGTLDAPTLLQQGSVLLAIGDRAGAREQLGAALRAARAGEHDYVAMQSLTQLAGLSAAEGDFGLMVTLATAADEENTRRGWQHTVEAATTAMLLAYGALLRADPAECLRQANRAGTVVDEGEPPTMRGLHLSVQTLRGAAEFELGDRTSGARRVAAARLVGGSARFADEQVALCATVEHRMALLLGWGPVAAEVLAWAQEGVPNSAEVHLMRARAQLVLGRRDAAAKLLQPALDGSVEPVLRWSAVEAWLLATEIALIAGDDMRARRSLKRALTVGQQLDVPYPVVFAAPEVTDLLTSRLGTLGGVVEKFAERVFALRRALHVPPMVPLTARERAVLRLLPTLRSFEEIADDLTVSANTVKTHVRAIYTKLGVTKRRDAVTVAQERGLLEGEHDSTS